MLFHSRQFNLFFVIVFFLNLFLANVAKLRGSRKWLLLIASMIFYTP